MIIARDAEHAPYFVPVGILAEVGYMLQRRPQLTALDEFLADLTSGAYAFDCGERDFARIHHLVHRYADLELGLSDAAVIACAERRGGKALTSDRRDFDIVARGEKTITVLP